MFALHAHDDADAELLRLRRELMGFVVDEISRTAPAGRSHALAGPVADAITVTAAAATRAELIHLGHGLANQMIAAFEPQLTERLPALVQAAVAKALAEQLAHAPHNAMPWLPLLAINGLALAVGLAALLM